MRVAELLDEIEPLTHRERCRRLAELAREGAAAEVLEELGRGDHYERSLAIFMAAAARDAAGLEHLAGAMRDPAVDLAEAAIGWSARLGVGAEAFATLLDDAPMALRATAYQAIRRWRRTDLAEALIERVAARWGPGDAGALLAVCGESVARERLGALPQSVPNWASFGRAHPGLMLDHAEESLAALPQATRRHWWWGPGSGVAAAVEHAPGRVIGLLEDHWLDGRMPGELISRLGVLLDADGDRMMRVLLSHRDQLAGLLRYPFVRRRMTGLGDDDLAAVARAVRSDGYVLRLLLDEFPPSRREHVFELAMASVDRGAVELDPGLLDVLPAAARIREARRMLRLRRVAETPARYREFVSYLPYDEAFPILKALAERPDADERATGYRLLIGCAGRARDPEVLAGLLDVLGRLRNEQDPVRSQALRTLASVPPGSFRSEHAAAFARLADDALNARDCSYDTRAAIAALARVLCRQGNEALVAAGLELFGKLTDHQGEAGFGRLDMMLPRGAEHDLVRGLAARMAESQRRGDHGLPLTLARSLGRRGHDVPRLQDALEKAVDASETAVAKEAIRLWLAPPRTSGERVGRLLAREPSAVTVGRVFAVIAAGRTDLLDTALSGDLQAGRFATPGVIHVPSATRSWLRRWTAGQRARYLELKHLLAQDEGTPAAHRAEAVRDIGAVPGMGAEGLLPYLGHPDALLRRAALTAAPWISTPQEMLPVLLEHASGDDAHVAVYAAARAARFVPPSALAGHLGPALRAGKITSRKEALRILLHNEVPGAMALIEAAWDDPGQHRDVRAAIASAVRARLDDPVAMRILTEAANGPRDLARQVLGTSPLQVEDRHRAAYARLVVRIARSTDPETRSAALPALPAWAPWAPDAPAVAAAVLTDLTVTGWQAGLNALVGCATSGTGTAELAAAAETLGASPAEPDAAADRDRPAFQRLRALVEAVRGKAVHARDATEPALRALDGRLPEPWATLLLAAAIRWDSPDVATEIDVLADRPIGGVLAIAEVAHALASGGVTSWSPSGLLPEPAEVLPHAARLAGRGDLTGGLFACALIDRHGPRAGWPEEWRAPLRLLRTHPHPDVTYTARHITTAEE
ncbi:hypothetical protein ACGFNU_40225 [Spirillospora sp. NPDC048911]|uniref:hypothetical protein n=1 Tax=Spirillospora sp. NPDC048911 TaxID=3364527 RepID=UPI00371B408E